jgi:hypothetical protein
VKTPTDIPRYAELAARALARDPGQGDTASDALTPAPIALPDRAATVREIQRALHSRARRRVTRWMAVTASAFAAAAAVAIFVGWRGFDIHRPGEGPAATSAPPPVAAPSSGLAIAAVQGSGASIEIGGTETPAVPRAELRPGATVHAPRAGQVVLALDTGTRLRVGADGRTRIVELGTMQRFALESGSLEASVAKLQPGHRFVVATPDAEVEVKGTRFELTVDGDSTPCEPDVRTRLVVQEGVVAVRHGGSEVRVAAGSVWPTCVPPPAPAAPEVHAAAMHRTRAHGAGHGTIVDPAPAPAAVAVDPSTLAEQNDIFAAALAARQRGNRAEAIRWLDRLIARYPVGQLGDSARAERRRLIEGPGPAPSE